MSEVPLYLSTFCAQTFTAFSSAKRLMRNFHSVAWHNWNSEPLHWRAKRDPEAKMLSLQSFLRRGVSLGYGGSI